MHPRGSTFTSGIFFAAAFALTATSQGAIIYYVDCNATGQTPDGLTWCNAYLYVQDALAVASSGDEIRVAECTYRPDDGTGQTSGDRHATFALVSGVEMYGGYDGCGAQDPDARTPRTSILSGDLDEDDIGFFGPTRDDNSYHVVTASFTLQTTVLDGFTISGGHADGTSPDDNGGGIYSFAGSSAIANCLVQWNFAGTHGGAIYIKHGVPTVSDCDFTKNEAAGGEEIVGGSGIYNKTAAPVISNCNFYDNGPQSFQNSGGGAITNVSSSPTIEWCTFTNNRADAGAGIFNKDGSHAEITYCQFFGNEGFLAGGAIANLGSDPAIGNCLFSGNTASSFGGGAISNSEWSSPEIYNCTFANNSAGIGGAIMSDSGDITITNCIFWNDIPDEVVLWGQGGTVTYSDVEGGYTGTGNINSDPLFVDDDGPDDTVGTEDDNLRLSDNSPCIDAGDNNGVPQGVDADLDGQPRIVDGDGDQTDTVDMGAYEYFLDCNNNGIADSDDIAAGTSSDSDADGIPDECECECECVDCVEAPTPEPNESGYAEKGRYISFEPKNVGQLVAFFIGDAPQSGTCSGSGTACATSADCPRTCGISGNPCPPRCPFPQVCMKQICVGASPGSGAWVGEPDALGTALVVEHPVYRVWTETVIHVGDCEIVPSASYKVHSVHLGCDLDDEDSYSDPVTLTTALWGDIVGFFDGTAWTPANGVINILDLQAIVEALTEQPTAPPMTWADLEGEVPNRVINANDVLRQSQAAQGNPYPFSDPEQCP